MTALEATVTTETDDLLSTLALHRGFLRHTVQGLTDEQARQRTTVSALHLAGLIKHVALTEAQWADFCVRGRAVFDEMAWAGSAEDAEWDADAERPDFTLAGEETLESVLAHYAEVAARTEDVVRSVPTSGPRTSCRRPRGGRRAGAGRSGGPCCT